MSDDLRAAEALEVLKRLDAERIETKADIPSAILDVSGREITQLFSVDNLDRVGDVTSPKAFNRSIGLGLDRIPHLFMHDERNPAIGRVLSIEQVGRHELPADVQQEYPEATGGAVFVSRLLKAGRGAEVYEGIQEGIKYGASFGFIAKKAIAHPSVKTARGTPARWLQEVHLTEVTTALPGTAANLATRSRLGKVMELLTEMKAGRRHSASDVAMLNEIALLIIRAGATNISLLESDPAQPPAARTSPIDSLIADIETLYEVT